MSNYFIELSKINVSEHMEKKGRFNYLSWVFAVSELRKNHPDATWETKRFDGMPFMQTDLGYFVEVAVTVNGIELSQIHPVLDNRNKPIEKPSPFDINTSIQRCLVKAIALHGLGLYIYAGEDLPTTKDPLTSEQVGQIKTNVLKLNKLVGAGELNIYNKLGIKKVNDINSLSKTDADKVLKTLDKWIDQAGEKNQSTEAETKKAKETTNKDN